MIVYLYIYICLIQQANWLEYIWLFRPFWFPLLHSSHWPLVQSLSHTAPCVFLPPPQFGDSQQLRLVRILRSTVMVRVGGGWMALDEFLVKNDPCRGEFSKSATRNAALSTLFCPRRNLKFRNFYLLLSKSLLGKVQIGVIFNIYQFLTADCE